MKCRSITFSLVLGVVSLFSATAFSLTIPFHSMGVTYNGLHKTTSPTAQDISSDFDTIKNYPFDTIRTYYPQYTGSIGVMPLAKQQGLNVLLSLYIFPDHLNDWVPDNYNSYMKSYIQKGDQNLQGVLIGNEDIGSNDAVYQTIVKYLKQVKSDNASVPVSTAQTTDFWLNDSRASQVAKLCDFIAVNIYPAWDWQNPGPNNQPGMTVDQGFVSFTQQYQAIKAKYPGKQIVVTETGWPTTFGWVVNVPSQPRQFQQGLDNAKAYFDKVKAWASTNQVNVYYYSMFDDWYGVNTSSQYNFHFGLLDSQGYQKVTN